VNDTAEISDLIKDLRSQLGLTQEQLAARLGVTFPTVNRWENQRAKPSKIALKLIKAEVAQLGAASDELLAKYF
jgi:putative transcriptional regulator